MPGTADTFTTSNRLDKQPTGGNYNLWGQYLNTNFDLIDDLKDGNLILSMSTTQHTLTLGSGATDEARMASIMVIGTPGGTGTITAPNVPKLTIYENLVFGSYPLVITNGTGTSCTIPNGAVANVQCTTAGNMNIVGGSVFGGRTLNKIGTGTASDDAVRMDQVSLVAHGVPSGGTLGYVLRHQGTNTATISGTATATETYGWEEQGYATIYVPASALTPTTTNGGTATTIMCTTSSKMVKAMVFGSATTQNASFDVQMPRSWDGSNCLFSFNAFTTGATGTAVFEMSMGLAQSYNGVTIDRPFNYVNGALGTEKGTASFVAVTGTITGSVSGGAAALAPVLSLMARRRIGGSDNMSGNLFLTGCTVRYMNNLPNDN